MQARRTSGSEGQEPVLASKQVEQGMLESAVDNFLYSLGRALEVSNLSQLQRDELMGYLRFLLLDPAWRTSNGIILQDTTTATTIIFALREARNELGGISLYDYIGLSAAFNAQAGGTIFCAGGGVPLGFAFQETEGIALVSVSVPAPRYERDEDRPSYSEAAANLFDKLYWHLEHNGITDPGIQDQYVEAAERALDGEIPLIDNDYDGRISKEDMAYSISIFASQLPGGMGYLIPALMEEETIRAECAVRLSDAAVGLNPSAYAASQNFSSLNRSLLMLREAAGETTEMLSRFNTSGNAETPFERFYAGLSDSLAVTISPEMRETAEGRHALIVIEELRSNQEATERRGGTPLFSIEERTEGGTTTYILTNNFFAPFPADVRERLAGVVPQGVELQDPLMINDFYQLYVMVRRAYILYTGLSMKADLLEDLDSEAAQSMRDAAARYLQFASDAMDEMEKIVGGEYYHGTLYEPGYWQSQEQSVQEAIVQDIASLLRRLPEMDPMESEITSARQELRQTPASELERVLVDSAAETYASSLSAIAERAEPLARILVGFSEGSEEDRKLWRDFLSSCANIQVLASKAEFGIFHDRYSTFAQELIHPPRGDARRGELDWSSSFDTDLTRTPMESRLPQASWSDVYRAAEVLESAIGYYKAIREILGSDTNLASLVGEGSFQASMQKLDALIAAAEQVNAEVRRITANPHTSDAEFLAAYGPPAIAAFRTYAPVATMINVFNEETASLFQRASEGQLDRLETQSIQDLYDRTGTEAGSWSLSTFFSPEFGRYFLRRGGGAFVVTSTLAGLLIGGPAGAAFALDLSTGITAVPAFALGTDALSRYISGDRGDLTQYDLALASTYLAYRMPLRGGAIYNRLASGAMSASVGIFTVPRMIEDVTHQQWGSLILDSAFLALSGYGVYNAATGKFIPIAPISEGSYAPQLSGAWGTMRGTVPHVMEGAMWPFTVSGTLTSGAFSAGMTLIRGALPGSEVARSLADGDLEAFMRFFGDDFNDFQRTMPAFEIVMQTVGGALSMRFSASEAPNAFVITEQGTFEEVQRILASARFDLSGSEAQRALASLVFRGTGRTAEAFASEMGQFGTVSEEVAQAASSAIAEAHRVAEEVLPRALQGNRPAMRELGRAFERGAEIRADALHRVARSSRRRTVFAATAGIAVSAAALYRVHREGESMQQEGNLDSLAGMLSDRDGQFFLDFMLSNEFHGAKLDSSGLSRAYEIMQDMEVAHQSVLIEAVSVSDTMQAVSDLLYDLFPDELERKQFLVGCTLAAIASGRLEGEPNMNTIMESFVLPALVFLDSSRSTFPRDGLSALDYYFLSLGVNLAGGAQQYTMLYSGYVGFLWNSWTLSYTNPALAAGSEYNPNPFSMEVFSRVTICAMLSALESHKLESGQPDPMRAGQVAALTLSTLPDYEISGISPQVMLHLFTTDKLDSMAAGPFPADLSAIRRAASEFAQRFASRFVPSE